MNPGRWLPALALIALLALGAWWWNATEWVEVRVPRPARGEAAQNRWFAVEQLARAAGATVRQREHLDVLPPPGATLLIDSHHWNLFPEREAALRQWVAAGGHLVLPTYLLPGDSDDRDAVSLGWVPLRVDHDEADHHAVVALRKARPRTEKTALCRSYREPDHVAPAFGRWRPYRVCDHDSSHLIARDAVRWSVDSPAGPYAADVPVGRGSVTALVETGPLDNRLMLDGDHGLVAAAVLQLRAGREIWLLGDERREPLLSWLWQRGWIAVLLALFALALALWRAGVRFGPLQATPPPARRAVTEQVRGTAAFVAQHGGAALLIAQQRALTEAAQRQLPDFAALDPTAQAQAVAARTGLAATRLAAAWQRRDDPAPGALVADLQLLETARRRLASSSSSSTQDSIDADRR